MLTDLQKIEGMEELRAAWTRAHPERPLATDSRATDSAPAPPMTASAVLEAWLMVTLRMENPGAAQRRLLRAFLRHLESTASDSADGASDEPGAPGDPALKALTTERPGLLRDALRARARLIAASDPDGTLKMRAAASVNQEAERLASLLPGMRGPNAWKCLALLGRRVVLPDAPMRRFLWRVGLLPREPGTSRKDVARAVACIEDLMSVTGTGADEARTLLEWHTRAGGDAKGAGAGGGRCGATPACPGCPFEPFCPFGRFRPAAEPAVREEEKDFSPDPSRLHRRLDEEGSAPLGDPELLAFLIGRGNPDRRTLALAESLLRRFGGLGGLESSSSSELREVKGLGAGPVRRLKAALELGRRLSTSPLRRGDPITCSEDIWRAYRHRYRHIPQEHFITLLLDSKNRLIQSCLVSKGTLTGSMAHPREVFKEAVRHSASAIILMHNHPSGDPEPSPEDRSVTRRLAEAGEVLGIRVLDHMILGAESYFSFKDEELI